MQRRSVFWVGGAAILAAVGAVLAFGGTGLAQSGTGPSGVRLDAVAGADLVGDPDILLVDIRTPEEWQQTGVIEGALLITYTGPDRFLQAVRPHLQPDQTLALVCRSGNRTSRAARQIAGLIDNPVLDVQGGMIRVVREGYVPVAAKR